MGKGWSGLGCNLNQGTDYWNMLIIVKWCAYYHTATVKGVILNHFLLLPNVVQKGTCTIKLFQNDSLKKIINVWMSRNNTEQESAVTMQLPLTRLCWAITHLCLLMLPISITAPFFPTNLSHFLWWLLHCVTYLDTSIKPGNCHVFTAASTHQKNGKPP